MSSPLLALPREIRDNIYSYLHQDITFRDDYGYNLLENSIIVTIENAPLPHLLEVNWQLRKEYTDSIQCSAHIATDGLDATKSFRDLEPRLQHILTRHVQTVTLIVDWRYRCEHHWKDLQGQPEKLWRLLQRYVHNVVHPQVTTLKIEYLDFIQEPAQITPETLPTEDVVLALRERHHGTMFPLPPRRLDGLRLVQCAEAYTTMRFAYIGVLCGVRPARIAFLAYSAPGHKLNEQSFWSVNEQDQLCPLEIDGLGYMKNGKYCKGIQLSRELRDIVDRRRVDAIMSSANYTFTCETPDCEKCAESKRQNKNPWADYAVKNHEHGPPYTCCGPRGPLLPDAPRDLEPGWQEVYNWPAANRFHRHTAD